MVAVLMSTYNGAAYLRPQIDSILRQSYGDFVLIIRDDGSSDGTVATVESYADPRIRLIRGENLGPAKSFFALLAEAKEFEYLFFCDQDDVWGEEKIEEGLKRLSSFGDRPAMVFTDFSSIDGEGKTTDASYAACAGLRVREGLISVSDILMHPYVFGCASCINRALAQRVTDPPEGIEMHDCWISLTAACLGGLYYDPNPTLAHRFHSSNATGRAGQNGLSARFRRLTKGFRRQCENSALRLRQTQLLLDRFSEEMVPSQREILTHVADACRRGRFAAVRALRSRKIARQGRLNTWFMYLTVLNVKGDIL